MRTIIISSFFSGAIGTIIGSIIGIFLKDFIITNYFIKKKEKNELIAVYKKYRIPIRKAAVELHTRFNEVIEKYPPIYLKSNVLKIKQESIKTNTIADEHFQKYKLVSSIYRLYAFLGWIELYRQEIILLDCGSEKRNCVINKSIDNIISWLADGQLNINNDWENWDDYLIFREECRAIGEMMIINNNGRKEIIGYMKFVEFFENSIINNDNQWIGKGINLLIDLKIKKDFRKNRIENIKNELSILIGSLEIV